MIAVIVTPYAGDGSNDSPYHPLVNDIVPAAAWVDRTDRSMGGGIPGANIYVIESDVSGQQLSAIKSDDRFFVLSPGPGNTGSALTNWLSSKGATGHGVTNSDNADQATDKLREYCRNL